MPLLPPNLDDRSFQQLLDEAKQRLQQSCPDWTDLSPHDPGMVILELFSFLTEAMIYRLNRVPEKAYIEFLRMIGVKLHPPAAASTRLVFSYSRSDGGPVEIPRGTRVTLGRAGSGSEPPVFITARSLTIPVGTNQIEVLGYQCDLVEAELAGVGTGLPGLSMQLRRPPVISPTGDALDLMVGVEVAPEEIVEGVPVISSGEKTYRIWREASNFTNLEPDDPYIYTVDRLMGLITFAPAARMEKDDGALEETPAALAAVPSAGREICVWYRRGGGPEGNVAANTLTVLKDPIPGVEVTNPEPATGGLAAETLANALVRGPQELHSLERAVTSRDFELMALNSAHAVCRAKALARAALWSFASPGTVEVLLVPRLQQEDASNGKVSVDDLIKLKTETARAQVQDALDMHRPLGITCLVNWARYKTVRAKARVVVRVEEDRAAIRQRVLLRLNQTISPLPNALNPSGWPFGQALHVSQVYNTALEEPGVVWVDNVKLFIDEVPEKAVSGVAADVFQLKTWYAGSGPTLFRSLDDGEGWEPVGRFPTESITRVATSPDRAGLLAAITKPPDDKGSIIHISTDCGESWEGTAFRMGLKINDIAWTVRDGTPYLEMATDGGLYELALLPGASPLQVVVDSKNPGQGYWAVTASRNIRGQTFVAVAEKGSLGVFLWSQGGTNNNYNYIGLRDSDVRTLEVSYDGARTFLWAGTASPGDDPGHGCYRWEIVGAQNPPDGPRPYGKNWSGGSCWSLAFQGTKVLAATFRSGVVYMNMADADPQWKALDANSGLPLTDTGRLQQVDTVSVDPQGRQIMAGGVVGLYRSQNGGSHYEPVSNKEFTEKVTLPPTWLFCSGDHDVTVVSEDEAN